MGEMNANRTRLVTLIQQAEEDSNALISVLPASIREDGQPIDHATLESESRAWISEQQTVLQRADRWHTLREDWVDAIDGSTSALVEDLTDTYLQMVNVEGVTTSMQDPITGIPTVQHGHLTSSSSTKSAKPRHQRWSWLSCLDERPSWWGTTSNCRHILTILAEATARTKTLRNMRSVSGLRVWPQPRCLKNCSKALMGR